MPGATDLGRAGLEDPRHREGPAATPCGHNCWAGCLRIWAKPGCWTPGAATGSFSVALARRGAEVVAIDVSANLVQIARDRTPPDLDIEYRVGDMLDAAIGEVDHVVAMDSLIHYETRDIVAALVRLAGRTRRSILLTVAPRTPALTVMHAVGRVFPRGDRAPAIVPVNLPALARDVAVHPDLRDCGLAGQAG